MGFIIGKANLSSVPEIRTVKTGNGETRVASFRFGMQGKWTAGAEGERGSTKTLWYEASVWEGNRLFGMIESGMLNSWNDGGEKDKFPVVVICGKEDENRVYSKNDGTPGASIPVTLYDIDPVITRPRDAQAASGGRSAPVVEDTPF